jgi:hypothetical protein
MGQIITIVLCNGFVLLCCSRLDSVHFAGNVAVRTFDLAALGVVLFRFIDARIYIYIYIYAHVYI